MEAAGEAHRGCGQGDLRVSLRHVSPGGCWQGRCSETHREQIYGEPTTESGHSAQHCSLALF